MTKICLNMIVKNESHVIERCLASVKRFIDYWVIVDTGSTDGTQQRIGEFMRDIPGELHERPWVNFAHNRNEALQLARGKGDYFLFIDADDYLIYANEYRLPELTHDLYCIAQRCGYKRKPDSATIHPVVFLIKDLPDFVWEGAIHEGIRNNCDPARIGGLKGIFLEYTEEGGRSQDPDKYQKDVLNLKEALQKEPNNGHLLFHLGLTYILVKEYQAALETLSAHVEVVGGKDREIFYSLYMIGKLQKHAQLPSSLYIKSFCQAYLFRPWRSEPLYHLAQHFLEQDNFLLAYLIAKFGASIPLKADLWVENWIYDKGFHEQISRCGGVCLSA